MTLALATALQACIRLEIEITKAERATDENEGPRKVIAAEKLGLLRMDMEQARRDLREAQVADVPETSA